MGFLEVPAMGRCSAGTLAQQILAPQRDSQQNFVAAHLRTHLLAGVPELAGPQLCKAPRLVSIVPKGLTGRLVLMTFIREILVDVLSKFAMTISEVPSSFVQNAFAIRAFEVCPKPKMQEKIETFACHHVSSIQFVFA